MSNNEKLRTEDIIEIYDGKILTSSGHPQIDVLPRESYASVLTKISLQVLTPEQKEAFDATLTTPSALNPVVLKDDLTTYVPEMDLGNVKDSVATFALLPVPFTAVGSTIAGDDHITIISTVGVIKRGDLVTSVGSEFAANTLVVDVISPTDVQILPDALLTNSSFTMTFSPVEGELRAVINDGIIYRWNGTAWTPFTRTGTMEHPELNNQNGDTNYQHLTDAQKSGLLTTSHSHANKGVLDGILSAGSGSIITATERNQLPSTTQKAALVGTSGTPSASNPYVTHLDPRLNTVRNPYVTIGPPGSLATFQGVDFRPFENAILAIDIGSASSVKAIEVLAGSYNLSGVPIVWSTQTSSLLLEGFTPQTATLSFQTRAPSVKVTGTGGQLIVRGFTFELNDQGTIGILSTRENTLIEDCIFKPGATASLDQIGIILLGAGSVVRRCRFQGQLTKGIEVRAPNCRIESCTFSLSLASNSAVDYYPSGSGFIGTSSYTWAGSSSSLVDHNFFTSGIVNIQSGVSFANITNNSFTSTTNYITDLGTSTRYLENQPEEVNQPFIGKKRTVGFLGTYADYRGSDEAPIIAALADPNVTEVEILEGTYTINNTIIIPEGKSLRGVWNGIETNGVTLLGADSVTVLKMSDYSRIENLQVEGLNAILVDSAVSGMSNVRIHHCGFNLTAENATTQYELVFDSPTDCICSHCSFKGQRGLKIYNGSTRSKILNNVFLNIDSAFIMPVGITNSKDHIKDNQFLTTAQPEISGEYLLVENNHFLGLLPTKLNTLYSIWQGNFPHPEANNDTGMDTMQVCLDKHLEASSDGVERSYISSCGSLSFVEDQTGISSTLPIDLNTKVDKTKPYVVKLYWTCADGLAGDVVWRITAVWRDKVLGVIGTSAIQSVVSSRTQSVSTDEDVLLMTFTNYGITSDPTHVSFIVERVGDSVFDTLAGSAHLLEVYTLIPRD